ncbi:MAG: DUF4296 domain-containing protein [Chitinophagales bacterium]
MNKNSASINSEKVIDSETMKKVLLDIHLAEAFSQSMKLDSSVTHLSIEEYYQQIFAIHGTNFEDFKKSFDYYTDLPDTLQLMYEEILNTLSKMESASMLETHK